MLVTVNAALDHFLQKRMSPTACAYMVAKYHTVGKRAVEITASLISFCQIFQKPTVPEFAECLRPSPNRRLWNAVSLKFCFTATLLSNCSDIKNGKKIVEESSEVQERFLLIEVRKQEFCQLKGIQLLNFLPSSLWNYLLLQICSEDRIILRGSIFFSKTTFFTIFRRENSLNSGNKNKQQQKKKTKTKNCSLLINIPIAMPVALKSNKKLTTDKKAVVFLLGFTLVNGCFIDKKHAVNYLWSNIFKLQLFHRLTWILIERLRAQTDRRWFRSYLLGCFVKCFYFVWSKIIISTSSCQKCLGEDVIIVVPAWWAVSMAKVGIGTAASWRVVDNLNVMASTENRSIKRALEYGPFVMTILPCLRQFHRCPSWLVNQREKKCLGIVSVLAAAETCWENKKRKMLIEIQTLM